MKLNKTYIAIATTLAIIFYALFLYQSIENRHLNNEIDRFKEEIEYLEGVNETLIESNQGLQDRLWHINNEKMKELEE